MTKEKDWLHPSKFEVLKRKIKWWYRDNLSIKYRPIYAITTFTKLEEDKLGWPEVGSTNTVGFYYGEKVANHAVKENNCDMWEYCYDYALIEKIYPGVYGCSLKRWLYKFDVETKEYKQIEEPEFFKHVMGYAGREIVDIMKEKNDGY